MERDKSRWRAREREKRVCSNVYNAGPGLDIVLEGRERIRELGGRLECVQPTGFYVREPLR